MEEYLQRTLKGLNLPVGRQVRITPDEIRGKLCGCASHNPKRVE